MYLKPLKTTREASDYQEKRILRMLPPSFRQSSNSGAGIVRKGDLYNSNWIIEAKTHMKVLATHYVKYGDLRELHSHGLAAGKNTAYIFDFGYGTEDLYELIKVEPSTTPAISDSCVFTESTSPKSHTWFRYSSYGVSFNKEKLKVLFVDSDSQFYIKTVIGTYRIRLFNPRNYM